MGGGGDSGGGGPQTSTSYNTNIPEYARPYVETMLGSAQQELFNYEPSDSVYEDVPIYEERVMGKSGQKQKVQVGTERKLVPGTGEMVPKGLKAYKPFNQDPSAYFAGFSPMQQQSQQGAANMTAAPQLSGATGMAAEAGLRGLDTRYNTGQFGANAFDRGAAQ
jgi:hypothetical protein